MLQKDIRACRRCEVAGYIPEANPITGGMGDSGVMLIGQAPGLTDHRVGVGFSGPAGRRLKEWLTEAGFAPEDFGTRIYFAALTKCFPGRLPGSSKDRAPSRAEMVLCRPWLNEELRLIAPRVVLLFGAMAINTFLGKAPLRDVIGKRFEQDGRIYIPLPHSSGASTWLNGAENRALLTEAIARIREVREELAGS